MRSLLKKALCWSVASRHILKTSSAALFVWMALEFVELDAVQFLEAFAAVLTRVVEMSFGRVLSHVPVQRRSLSTLIPTDLTSVDTHTHTQSVIILNTVTQDDKHEII